MRIAMILFISMFVAFETNNSLGQESVSEINLNRLARLGLETLMVNADPDTQKTILMSAAGDINLKLMEQAEFSSKEGPESVAWALKTIAVASKQLADEARKINWLEAVKCFEREYEVMAEFVRTGSPQEPINCRPMLMDSIQFASIRMEPIHLDAYQLMARQVVVSSKLLTAE